MYVCIYIYTYRWIDIGNIELQWIVDYKRNIYGSYTGDILALARENMIIRVNEKWLLNSG